jgi:enoyl-CoA hydratase
VDYWSFVIEGQVALVSPNQAAAPGSLNLAAVSELADLLDTIGSLRETARLIVITGREGQFLDDVDRDELAPSTPPGAEDETRDREERSAPDWYAWHRVGMNLHSIPQPIVAAIDGKARGGGYLIALHSTLRIASERAALGPAEVSLGIVGADGFPRLIRLVGHSRAAELLLSNRVVEAEEAKEIGLVNDVFPANGFVEKLLERCESIASVPNAFEIKRCLSGQDFVARSELWVERPWKGAASLVDGPAMRAGGPGAREPVAVGRSAQSGDCGCHSSSQRP